MNKSRKRDACFTAAAKDRVAVAVAPLAVGDGGGAVASHEPEPPTGDARHVRASAAARRSIKMPRKPYPPFLLTDRDGDILVCASNLRGVPVEHIEDEFFAFDPVHEEEEQEPEASLRAAVARARACWLHPNRSRARWRAAAASRRRGEPNQQSRA